jgi:hypothetical protein
MSHYVYVDPARREQRECFAWRLLRCRIVGRVLVALAGQALAGEARVSRYSAA